MVGIGNKSAERPNSKEAPNANIYHRKMRIDSKRMDQEAGVTPRAKLNCGLGIHGINF
jgi:hypothetical protein